MDCIFCGREKVKLTREHIFPRWLLKYLDAASETITKDLRSRLGIKKKTFKFINFTENRVCGKCNSKMLNSLEAECREVLKCLTGAHQETIEKTTEMAIEKRKCLAKWMFKTSILLANNGTSLIPKEHFEIFGKNDKKIPDNVFVDLGFCDHNQEHIIEWQKSLLLIPSSKSFIKSWKGYKVIIRIERLIFRVAFAPEREQICGDFLLKLWPNLCYSQNKKIYESLEEYNNDGYYIPIN